MKTEKEINNYIESALIEFDKMLAGFNKANQKQQHAALRSGFNDGLLSMKRFVLGDYDKPCTIL